MLQLVNISTPRLRGLNFEFTRRLWVIQADEPVIASEFAAVCAGLVPVRRGRVLVNGLEPQRTPAVREQIGSLQSEEALTGGNRLREWLSVFAGVGVERALSDLANDNQSSLLERRLSSLTPSECRRVALSLALNVAPMQLGVFFEPLDAVPESAHVQTLQRLHALAEVAPVLCVSTSPRRIRQLGGASHQLRYGLLYPAQSGAVQSVTWHARGRGLDRVAQALLGQHTAAHVEVRTSTSGDSELRFSAPQTRALILEFTECCVRTGASLFSLTQEEGQ